MAVRFSSEQVVQATGAARVQAGGHASYGGVSTDTRTLSPGCLFVPLVGEHFDGHAFLAEAASKGAAAVLAQKGRPRPPVPESCAVFEVPDTLAALGDLAHFHRQRFRIPLGAVTGSNGKTTTKEMAAAILATRGPALRTQGNLNNEVGLPLTLFGLEPTHAAAVVEMGMSAPGEIARLTRIAEPDAGMITSVQAAHLAGLGSIEGVAAAKGELFAGLKRSAVAVVNLDDARVAEQARRTSARQLTYGRAAKADVRLGEVRSRGAAGMTLAIHWSGRAYPVELSFLGEHNALNAAGAFALGCALGCAPEQCAAGLAAARPHPHRLTPLPAPGGITVLDDCYNANPASMAAALDALASLAGPAHAVAVLGDMLELGDSEREEHRELGLLAAKAAGRVAFFGPRSAFAHRAAELGERAAHFFEPGPLLEWLRPQLRAGDVVLVKGSRGMKLERVVDALAGQAPRGGH